MGFTHNGGRIAFEGQDLARVAAHQRPGLGIGYARRTAASFSAHGGGKHPAAGAGGQAVRRRDGAAAGAGLYPDAGTEGDGEAPRRLGLGGQGRWWRSAAR